MRLKILIVLVLFPIFMFSQGKRGMTYTTVINEKQISLELGFDKKDWNKNELFNIERTYLNEDLEMQMIFNKIKIENTIVLEKERIEYLKKRFADYDIDLIKIKNYNDKFYKSSYDENEYSFFIYSFFIEDYMIYVGFYNKMGSKKNTFSNKNNCIYIDEIMTNCNLQMNE